MASYRFIFTWFNFRLCFYCQEAKSILYLNGLLIVVEIFGIHEIVHFNVQSSFNMG